jgi:hypothetical protein
MVEVSPMNSFAPIDPALVDVRLPFDSGYSDAVAAGDTTDALKDVCGSASREFPKALWLEPDQWADKARENDTNHTWPMNFADRYTNQTPNHFCTCHSLGTNFEIARNRQRGIIYPEGPKAGFRYEESKTSGSVWVSPMSVYAEANPREWGGASCVQVMDIAIRRGFLPDKLQPKEYGFKHTLAGTTGKGGMNQSKGPWTPLGQFPAGWEETGKLFKIQEVIFPDTAEQVMCLILHGYSVCVGRSGHAVPYALANVAEKKIGYLDSYEITRWDSWGTVRGCANGSYAIASVTTPDDWNNPAGI